MFNAESAALALRAVLADAYKDAYELYAEAAFDAAVFIELRSANTEALDATVLLAFTRLNT